MRTPESIRPAEGKLGVLLIGLGAVSTTFVAGCLLSRRGLARPIGSLTQLGHIRLGARADKRNPAIRDFVGLAPLSSLEFGAWDIFADDAYTAASRAQVLQREHLEPIADELSALKPMPGVFFAEYVRRLRGEHIKKSAHRRDLVAALRDDIARFKAERGVSRCVAIWCGSTEVHQDAADIHASLAAFEQALSNDDPRISPSMLYAYACLKEGVAYANGAPNLSVDTGALIELAERARVPIAGKDLKTGQTLMKTMIAPGLKARMLGIAGWYSTNMLGNRDGEVLDDPDSFRSKEIAKLGVLESILEPELHPELYAKMHHQVHIHYYPPRGDQKQGWDNLDIFGWLGYPMQIKIDFACRDSILAAPLVLDLALFMDLAARAGLVGVQDWLSFYFKSPLHEAGVVADNDLFVQLMKLKNRLRWMHGETLTTQLGQEDYD